MQLCSPSDIHVASRKKKKYIQISLDSVTVYFACCFLDVFMDPHLDTACEQGVHQNLAVIFADLNTIFPRNGWIN